MTISLRAAPAGATAALAASLLMGGAACAQTFHTKDGGAIHFMYTPEYAKKIGRAPNQNTGEMEYFGGRVFSTVEVVSVIWGSNVSQQTVDGMPGFLKALPNSTFQDQLGEYSTKGVVTVDGHKSSNQTLQRGTFYGQVVIQPHNKHTTLSNKAVREELAYQIAQGNLPAENKNMLYMTYFPAEITITAYGLKSCTNYGAYHSSSSGHLKSTDIYYGVMPDCGYSFDTHTIIAAHEFAEATTDNIGTPGSNPAYPQAWNSANGSEIGDLCTGTQGELITKKKTYFVQQVYLNSTAACSTGNYTSP